MTHIARLMTITNVAAVTPNIMPFVHFQASQKGIEIKDKDRIAILQIENIPSYHIVFLDSEIKIDDIEAELAKQDTNLNKESRDMLERQLSIK
jgi:hypothetical protein